MAAIDLYLENPEDAADDGNGAFQDAEYDTNEHLTPLQRMEKLMTSENIFSRELLETLRAVPEDEAEEVLKGVVRLSQDGEPTVRAELMEQLPHLAMYCHETSDQSEGPVRAYLLPTVVKYLTDCNNQVRKTSQAALLVLLEQDLVLKPDVVEQVCPVIMELTSPEGPDEIRTEAVALMCKMAPLVGRDVTVEKFLQRFLELCTDTLFHVRKVCAGNFGDFAYVVGPTLTETSMLSKFFYLCEDGIWGVRKACAECFMKVSICCDRGTRQEHLAQVFINLISDQSRWVRMAAFQALGGFISTFADAKQTGLYFNAEGNISVRQPDEAAADATTEQLDASEATESDDAAATTTSNDNEAADTDAEVANSKAVDVQPSEADELEDAVNNERDDQPMDNNTATSSEEQQQTPVDASDHNCDVTTGEEDVDLSEIEMILEELDEHNPLLEPLEEFSLEERRVKDILADNNNCGASPTGDHGNEPQDGVEEPEYNSFLYWREPLLDIDNDVFVDEEGDLHRAVEDVSERHDEEVNHIGSTHVLGQQLKETVTERNGDVSEEGDENVFTLTYVDEEPILDDCVQDIIPQLLLDHYLSMTDPSRAQTVDTEITRHCAYNLPAVAFTLGPKNWPCLRELYDTLAADMQWKVRRTLAFSIHELAVIVGDQITTEDLVPVFNGFIKDLDEVRIGVLKHLADFLKLLRIDVRKQYLHKINEFTSPDNTRNWRFREELAQQLLQLLQLYSPGDVSEHLVPIAISLSMDKVAEVRHQAFRLLAAILRCLTDHGDEQLSMELVNHILQSFPHSTDRWKNRQYYAQICDVILETETVTPAVFARDFLLSLLALSKDKIPNVRISLVKTLSRYIAHSDYFTSAQNPHQEDLLNTLQLLRSDSDRDVRFFLEADATQELTELSDTIPV